MLGRSVTARTTVLLGTCLLLSACGAGEPEPVPDDAPSFFGTEAEANAARPPMTMIEARQPPDPPQLAAVPRPPRVEEVAVVSARRPPPPPTMAPMIATPPTPQLPVPAVFEVGFDAGGFGQWVAGPGLTVEGVAVSDGRRPAVMLRSSRPTDGPEPTDAVFVEVPPDIVERYAGREIEVAVRTRLPQGAPPGTAETAAIVTVGTDLDSGWRRFAPDDRFQTFRFRWTVPPSAPTLPNRIGIRVIPGGVETAVLVSAVSLGIVGDE